MEIDKLCDFEKKYPFLYEIECNGVPIYTCFRDTLSLMLSGKTRDDITKYCENKGKIYPKRIWDGLLKFIKFKRSQTLIFTSSVFRRDYGRNLAAEYLIEKYPDVVIFEWPSRVNAYDSAYFNDPQKNRYCPLDCYILVSKIYSRIYYKESLSIEQSCRKQIVESFQKVNNKEDGLEKQIIDFLIQEIPKSYALTAISQKLFHKFFRNYKNIEYVIDFWGSARENIIPVLPGDFESIELQHGIITEFHPGYIYPKNSNKKCKKFFDRTMLLYGDATKKLLIEKSVFSEEQIEVIGNPRIIKYKQEFVKNNENRHYILFTSQPFEQDIKGAIYYDEIIPILQTIQIQLETDEKWKKYTLAIKLHPRENNGIKNKYEETILGCQVFDNSTQLYEILGKSFLHITVNSTTLYEAALFDTPTVLLPYQGYKPKDIFGFDVKITSDILPNELTDKDIYNDYLRYLKNETAKYM